ncbi:hypothetical protein E0Z10_g5936 [Xylaria hypoxylon]|uniref:RRM domain-containing protein n=1 Tax=Xylaria hypoxylon TaxID=37992 RepID=A0A4Z0YTU7_9PEZI|nr:hypothetical protein E0Z10_g5936 [Xylaria hypoxylon]
MNAFDQMSGITGESFNQSSNCQNHTAAANQPRVANTSLLLTGLHRNITYSAVFNAIRNIGKIKDARIYDRAGESKATTIKFFSRNAIRLLNLAKAGYYRINVTRPSVTWNDDEIEGEEDPGDRSRGLKITGPQDIVNKISLEKIWDKYLVYDTEKVHEGVEGGIGVVEYYFAIFQTVITSG